MRRVVVLNAKGGSGKTTLAVNLAAMYAKQGFTTGMLDHDPQCSSLDWLERRPQEYPLIHGAPGFVTPGAGVTRSWQMRMAPGVERVVVDTPARPDRQQIKDLVLQADTLLLPILPSAIDIQAASRFIGELLLSGRLRHHGRRLGVVANRVRENARVYNSLQVFLESLDIPFVAALHDSAIYLHGAEQGLGICEMRSPAWSTRDARSWEQLWRWIEDEPPRPSLR